MRRSGGSLISGNPSFNPRTHMGCDMRKPALLFLFKSFNPRTHMGCDLIAVDSLPTKYLVSIHAPTWGATSRWKVPHPASRCFNPRTHMGCDAFTKEVLESMPVSIHAPTWGATSLTYMFRLKLLVSIHAPTWGATRFSCEYRIVVYVSIHAPTWGAT